MRYLHLTILSSLVVALALLGVGCGGGPTGAGPSGDADKGGETPKGELKPVVAEGRGTLKGTVVVAGLTPEILEKAKAAHKKALEEAKQDKEHCLQNDPGQQTWVVGAGDGLANVFVWVAPPDGHYFNLDEKDRDVKALGIEEVSIDQPHCAFIPRAVVLFPSYYDPQTKKQVPTGQKFTVKNSGTLNHNTNWQSAPPNRGDNKTVPPNSNLPIPAFRPAPREITFACNIHPWMRAYARVYDHPFATVTDKDGKFEIKNVPAGAELRLMYWHESMKEPKELKKITLKKDETLEEKITITAQ